MKQENEDLAELEWQRFKMQMVSLYPDQAKTILSTLDRAEEPEIPTSVFEDSEGNYERFSGEEIGSAYDALKSLGFALVDDDE